MDSPKRFFSSKDIGSSFLIGRDGFLTLCPLLEGVVGNIGDLHKSFQEKFEE
jgi:hypothetical protein